MHLSVIKRFCSHRCLLEELIKRDFKSKYKRTALGVVWSMLAPLMQLLVMALVFVHFFGRNTEHYIIYLFSGTLIFTYFSEATNQGMAALENNAHIFSRVNVPKYLFLLSRNVASLINFGLTMVLYFLFVAVEGIAFRWSFLLLLLPTVCLVAFNVGVGLILSALHVFFKDIKYLYGILTQLILYLSAIFYTVDVFSPQVQQLFYLNPLYAYIDYFRCIVVRGDIPSLLHHGICIGYAALAVLIGAWIYHRNNYKFLYYI